MENQKSIALLSVALVLLAMCCHLIEADPEKMYIKNTFRCSDAPRCKPCCVSQGYDKKMSGWSGIGRIGQCVCKAKKTEKIWSTDEIWDGKHILEPSRYNEGAGGGMHWAGSELGLTPPGMVPGSPVRGTPVVDDQEYDVDGVWTQWFGKTR